MSIKTILRTSYLNKQEADCERGIALRKNTSPAVQVWPWRPGHGRPSSQGLGQGHGQGSSTRSSESESNQGASPPTGQEPLKMPAQQDFIHISDKEFLSVFHSECFPKRVLITVILSLIHCCMLRGGRDEQHVFLFTDHQRTSRHHVHYLKIPNSVLLH